MAKFTDFYSNSEVKGIMESFLERFPGMFEGFNPDDINVIFTRAKKSQKPMNLRTVGYPFDVYIGKPYILEVFNVWWEDMNQMQKNMAVFHVMCAIPSEGFDETSKTYAKKNKPEINMYMLEYAACGGVPNWQENPMAKDPMERTSDEIASDTPPVSLGESEEAIPEDMDGIQRMPVTTEDIANVGLEKAASA
jgi:hypothetical protein